MAKIYSWDLKAKIEERIPKEIIEAMKSQGWNAFGIYEVVLQEIKKEKKPKA
jgi:hypothetical protein